MEGYPVNVLNNTSNVSFDNPFPISISLNNSNVNTKNPLPVDIISIPLTQTDAFGRIRVSNPVTLFDHFNRYYEDTRMVCYTHNTASSNLDVNSACMLLTVGSNIGDYIYRESIRVFAYQPGKSLLILRSFCMSSPKTGLRQRTGYFDTSNGIYLQLDGSNASFVKRSFTSGSILETVAIQDNWNYDPLKGNGSSGITLDLTRSQILFIDLEWLGVGIVRTGFVIDGKYCIAHIFYHSNRPSTITNDTTMPYMSTACLPIRTELENTAPTSSYSTYRDICASVITEGGYELRGKNYSIGINTLTSPISISSGNTFYAVVSIRLRLNNLGAVIIPVNFSIIALTQGTFRWALIKNGTITSPSWASINGNTAVEYAIDGGIVTNGIILRSGYFNSTANSSPTISLQGNNFTFQLERNSFTNTAYVFTLAAASAQGNDTVLGSIDYEEIT